MMLDSHLMIWSFLCGGFAGLLGFTLGLGGGIVIVPILSIMVGLPIKVTVAASIITIIATSMLVSQQKLKNCEVNIPLAIEFEVLALLGGVFGALLALKLEAEVIYKIFAVFAATMSILMIRKAVSRTSADDTFDFEKDTVEGECFYFEERDQSWRAYRIQRKPVILMVVAIAGVLSGLLGIGGGALMVPIMNVFNRIPMKVAAAMSAYVMGTTAMGGGIVYLLNDGVDYGITFALIVGVVSGVSLARRYLQKVESRTLQIAMSVVLVVVAVKMGMR